MIPSSTTRWRQNSQSAESYVTYVFRCHSNHLFRSNCRLNPGTSVLRHCFSVTRYVQRFWVLICPFDLKCSCYINITWLHDGHFGLNVRVRRDRLPSAMRKKQCYRNTQYLHWSEWYQEHFSKELNKITFKMCIEIKFYFFEWTDSPFVMTLSEPHTNPPFIISILMGSSDVILQCF